MKKKIKLKKKIRNIIQKKEKEKKGDEEINKEKEYQAHK